MSDEIAAWPLQPDTTVDGIRCGKCQRVLQHKNQNRCPYLDCRAYLRGRNNLWSYDKQKNADHA